MRAWLRDDGHEYPVDLAELDALIRKGTLSADAELRHVPWTGERFCRLRDLPPLQDALDAPDARFADYLRQRQVAWLTGAVAAMVMGAAMVQSALSGSELPWAAARLQRTFSQWAVGLEPTLLDGRWWTLWSSQLAHADLLHALFNVPIIAYCGYRVEQALAPGGALCVMAAALLCGGVAIVGLDDVPVYGSSIVAYGLWSAQIAIGLRMNEAVPSPLRGRYGMGNLIFFAPLYAASLFNAEVSHLGHGGGIIGGALVAFFLSAETMAPASQQERARARVLLLTALLTAAPLLLLAAASHLPTLAYAPYTEVYVEDAGAHLRLPARMAAHPVPVGELDGWRPSENGNEPFFVDQLYLEAPPGPSWTSSWWSRQLGAAARELPPPPPLAEGWQSHGLRVGRWTVIEHQLRRGRWLLRAGYVTRRPASPLAGRRRLYAATLATLSVGEIPSLAAAHARWSSSPRVWVLQRDYAHELTDAGRPAEADALLAGGAPDAAHAQERLSIWQAHPELAPPDALAWLHPIVTAEDDEALGAALSAWLLATGRCEAAGALGPAWQVVTADCPAP